MTPATATTTAKAVRQHGGGLVYATQPRAALRGRQQCPSGGVKKSLCCAAAGINALALQPPAALAYPMTGVRQAQKLSTPLRFPIRPSAQLVVGYSQVMALKRQCRQPSSCRLPNTSYSLHSMPHDNPSVIQVFLTKRGTLNCKVERNNRALEAAPQLYPAQPSLGAWYRAEPNLLHQSQIILQSQSKLLKREVVTIFLHHFQSRSEHITHMFRNSNNLLQVLDIDALIALNPAPFLKASQIDSDSYRTNRANSLHPRRCTDRIPRQIDKTKDRQYSQRGNQPQLWTELEVNRDFIGQHAHLLGIQNLRRLQAPCGQVQRGAA